MARRLTTIPFYEVDQEIAGSSPARIDLFVREGVVVISARAARLLFLPMATQGISTRSVEGNCFKKSCIVCFLFSFALRNKDQGKASHQRPGGGAVSDLRSVRLYK